METHRVIGKGIIPKRADDDKEALRTAIVRNVVKNYLWNSSRFDVNTAKAEQRIATALHLMSVVTVCWAVVTLFEFAISIPAVTRISDHLEMQSSLDNLDMCEYLKNKTDIETLEQHQFGILEQCLYYYLAGEAQRKSANVGVVHALATLPPSIGTKKPSPVTINFNQITLQHFELVLTIFHHSMLI
ncbi:unnamed protein product [Anisakis simplex]|uniref:G_PROTEIN_RECEP_F1_2 domain-containing protein n=1 Tax=Anisakis simplex TaxID=6269 RepID=A0A0M3K388_ANISI|nr:unnamed protein product [Anisakis simplex]